MKISELIEQLIAIKAEYGGELLFEVNWPGAYPMPIRYIAYCKPVFSPEYALISGAPFTAEEIKSYSKS